jgi:hypothetical protein
MDWMSQAAAWHTGVLAQPWLEAWQPATANTPDWALLAAGPAALSLIALLMRLTCPGPRASAANASANATPPPASLPPAPQHAKMDEAPKLPIAVPPARGAERSAAPAKPAARATTGDASAPATAAAQTAAAPVRRASGVPNDNERERKARVFLSSTFRDMRAEREVLATDTFPSLKRKFRARGVEVQEVDLRWGVNEGDATLDVCLQAVRRSNWFVGLIGQRYGTTLKDEATVAQLGSDYPAVREGLGRSLTEIEILEGVLLNAKGDKQTLFFERDPAWLDTLSPSERPEYEERDAEARTKLAELKTHIRERVGVMHVYTSPQAIDAAFEQTMSEALEKAFPPVDETNDPFAQEHRLHAAYARERLGLYVGGEDYLDKLDAWMAQDDAPPKIVVGASGGGKSTLIAHWTSRRARAHPNDIIFAHYLGASPDSANPAALVRRLWLHLNRITGDDIAIPSPDTELGDLREQVSDRLALAVAFAAREKCFILIALDGLDKLSEEHLDLRWWPRTLPPRIKVLASSSDGKARDASRERSWSELAVKQFDASQQSAFIADTLKGWDKSDFPEARKRRVLSHALAGLPLFLKTILEELRVSAANEVLDARLDDYLKAPSIPGLFARILAQIEHECGKDFVAQALSLVWASRVGLEEDEIIATTSETKRIALGPAGLAWERLRNRLSDNLRDSQGRVAFSHDYLRQAVEAAYLNSEDVKRRAHLDIANRFEAREADQRQAEELPYQLRAAEAWERLEGLLTDLDRFDLLRGFGDGSMLGFWLPLQERGRDVEALLCHAVSVRNGGRVAWTRSNVMLANSVGAFLHFAGFRGVATLALCEGCQNAAHSLFGAENDITVSTLQNLGRVHSRRGDFQGGRNAFEAALVAQTHLHGESHALTLMLMGELAAALSALGYQDAAQDLQENALEQMASVLGASHPSVLALSHDLAALLYRRGHLEQAQEIQQQAADGMSDWFGPEHLSTLSCKSDLALTLNARGNSSAARDMQETIVEEMVRLLGPEHPSTLIAMNNLAMFRSECGDPEGAESLLEHVVALRSRLYGKGNSSTLRSVFDLLGTLKSSGDLQRTGSLEQTIDQQMRSLSLEEMGSVLGFRVANNPVSDLIANDLQLILVHSDRGDDGKVSKLAEQALETIALSTSDEAEQVRILNDTHADTGSTKSTDVITRRKRILFEVITTLNRRNPRAINMINYLPTVLQLRREYAEAIMLAEEVAEVMAEILGTRHSSTLTSEKCRDAVVDGVGGGEKSPRRVVTLLHGQLDHGGPFWCYVAVKPDKLVEFSAAQERSEINLYHFEEFGEVVTSAEGEVPPINVTLKVAEFFGLELSEMFADQSADYRRLLGVESNASAGEDE